MVPLVVSVTPTCLLYVRTRLGGTGIFITDPTRYLELQYIEHKELTHHIVGLLGLTLGGVFGTVRQTTPVLFALASGIQTSTLAFSWTGGSSQPP